MGMHEKQVQVVKVDSVDLPSDEGIVQVTGNNNRGKLFGEEEGSGIHIVGMHAHAAQHRHNHASGQEGCHGQVVVLGKQNIGEGSGSVSEGYGNVTDGQSVQGRRTEHPTIRHDSFVPISASVVITLEVDAPYRSVIPSMRTKRKLMYDSVNVLEVGSSSKKQSIASKVGLQHESNFPSICNDVLAMEYMCMNPGRGGRNENTHKSDSYDDAYTATSKEQLSVCDTGFVVVGVDTPEVLLRTMALRHATSFLELYSLVKVDIEKGEVTNMSVDNIDIGDPLVKDLNFITINLILRSLPLHAYSYKWRIKVQNERNHEKVGMKREERKFKKFLALEWHLEKIHVTWAHLEKK
ncbi:hypothetical protein Tco_1337971 [Tanacetum coccineum]